MLARVRRTRALALVVMGFCCQPAHADEPAPDAAMPRPSAVVLRIQGHLAVAERAGLKALLEGDFGRRGLTLRLEDSDEDLRSWVKQRRLDASVLLIAILEVQSSESWQLSIVDAVRGRAIARPLPGGVAANAATLEAVASIVSSAASALRDGLEVASRPIDEVVAPPRRIAAPSQAPAVAAAAAPSDPAFGVCSSLGVVAASFAPEAHVTFGFSAALGLKLRPWNLRIDGTQYLPVELDSALGTFRVDRTALAAGVGRTFAWGRFELEPQADLALERLRRSGAQSTEEVDASPDQSLFRLGGQVDLRLRYRLGQFVALEWRGSAYYFAQRARFLGRGPAAMELAVPWLGGGLSEVGVEVRAP